MIAHVRAILLQRLQNRRRLRIRAHRTGRLPVHPGFQTVEQTLRRSAPRAAPRARPHPQISGRRKRDPQRMLHPQRNLAVAQQQRHHRYPRRILRPAVQRVGRRRDFVAVQHVMHPRRQQPGVAARIEHVRHGVALIRLVQRARAGLRPINTVGARLQNQDVMVRIRLPIRRRFHHRVGPRRKRPCVRPRRIHLRADRQVHVGGGLIGRNPHPRNAPRKRIEAMPYIGMDGEAQVAGGNLVRGNSIHRQQVGPLIVDRVRRKHLAPAETGVAVDPEVQRGSGDTGSRRTAVGHLHGHGVPALSVDLRGAHHPGGRIQAHPLGKTHAGGRYHRPGVGRFPTGRRQSRAVALILRGHGDARCGDGKLRHRRRREKYQG